MKYVYSDGGRKAAGFKGTAAGDCVCRAISIAAELPYKEVYDLINYYSKREQICKTRPKRSSARTGVYKSTIDKVMKHIGWKWVSLMGKGQSLNLSHDKLPSGRLVLDLSGHCTAVIDNVIHDTFDCSNEYNNRIYGYYIKDDNIE